MPNRDQIADALRKHRRVDVAAESLGLGLRRMYRFMERYGLTLKGVLVWPSMPPATKEESAPTSAAAQPASSAPQGTEAKPERDIRCLTARDFGGASMGDVGSSSSHAGSADEMLARYNRLRRR
jgi:hypothetical protein